MAIDDATVKRFALLFRGRTDAAGRLSLNGRAYQDKIDVDEGTYRAHVEGKKWPICSLGVYPLTDAGLVAWGAADIDLGDEASAWRVADALEALGVRAFVELSKGKGHHVWAFWEEWVPGYAVRRVLKRAAQEAQVACEIFPKQDNVSADSPYGNFLHLPYPGHPEAAGGRYFIGRDGRALKLEEFLDRVETSRVPEWAIEREPVRLSRADRLTRGVYTGDRPACVQALLDGPVPEGQRNDALARLAAHLINTEGAPQGESIAHHTGCAWGLGEREVERTIRSVKESGRWWGCNGKRAVPVMAAACNWEACPFHRSAERERSGPTFVIAEDDAPPVATPPPTFSGEQVADSLLDLVAPHGFLRHYVDYCTSLSDAPPIAHLAGALTLVATMLGNRVQTLGFSGSYLRPNLWIVFIAPSGARKSSVMGKVTHFLLQTPAAGARLMSNTASKEGWFDELHRNPSRLLRADEFVGLLNHLGRKHMGGAQDFLTELFANNRVTDNTRTHGNMTIVNPAVSIIGGCTPTQLEEFAKRADFASGFLARFIFLPASKEAPAPKRIPRPRPDVEDALLKRLGWMASLTGEITFDEAINERLCTWADQFKQAERDNAGEAMGQLNRAFDFAIKLAMVMQVAETEPGAALWRDLDPDVVERAIALTEWLIRATMKLVNEDLADSEHERDLRTVLRAVERAGGTIGRRELRKKIRHLKERDFQDIVRQLIDGGELEEGEQQTGGRPATVYRLVDARGLTATPKPLMATYGQVMAIEDFRVRKG